MKPHILAAFLDRTASKSDERILSASRKIMSTEGESEKGWTSSRPCPNFYWNMSINMKLKSRVILPPTICYENPTDRWIREPFPMVQPFRPSLGYWNKRGGRWKRNAPSSMSCQSKFRRLDVGRCADMTFSGKGKEELFSYAILKSRGNIGFLKFACDIKSAIRGSFVSM